MGVALATIIQLRLSLPGPSITFSTADNPIAKATSMWTRFLTFTHLPVINFKLLLYPSTLSFDWGMEALPRLTSIFDFRNVISLVFYTTMAKAVCINVQILRQRLPAVMIVQRRVARLTKKRLQSTPLGDCLCAICKQGLNLRHSSTCRAINNNNIPAPSVQCGCPPFRHSSPSPVPMKKNSDLSGETTTSTITPAPAAVLLSLALLALPFLPAANLFFYVGFVVAERILYLPSVGYCLLVGLGVGKLMDSNRGLLKSPRKRYAMLVCICTMLIACSLKTMHRNLDWKDEESLYRSAVRINPPKGKITPTEIVE